MIITTCGNSIALAKALARKLKSAYSPLTISTFPDGDIYLKYNTNLAKKTVVIVESFQPNSQQSFFRILIAAETAKDLGARKVILIAPYLAFLRQDARFKPGEAISSKIMGKHLSSCLDNIITIDPHLHRYRSLREVFSIGGHAVTANGLITEYIRAHYPDAVLVGPDWESSQWAGRIARKIAADSTIFAKKRYSSRKVKVEMIQPIPLKDRTVVIVDDIISTGCTLVEAAREAYRHGAQEVIAIAVHGIFAENAWQKLRKAGVKKVITTNCIEHSTNEIDVMPLLADELKTAR